MRAVFFGDSMTYGHGLPDCAFPDKRGGLTSPGPCPSKLGWASIVSNGLGLPCLNLSVPGASNMEIHWRARNAGLNPDDLVFVEWSYCNRDCLLEDPLIPIGPWLSTENSIDYYRAHPDKDISRRNMLVIEHTAMMFDRIGLKWLFFSNDEQQVGPTVDNAIIDYFERYKCDHALDDAHPGMRSNQIWAEKVIGYARERLSDNVWPYQLRLP